MQQLRELPSVEPHILTTSSQSPLRSAPALQPGVVPTSSYAAPEHSDPSPSDPSPSDPSPSDPDPSGPDPSGPNPSGPNPTLPAPAGHLPWADSAGDQWEPDVVVSRLAEIEQPPEAVAERGFTVVPLGPKTPGTVGPVGVRSASVPSAATTPVSAPLDRPVHVVAPIAAVQRRAVDPASPTPRQPEPTVQREPLIAPEPTRAVHQPALVVARRAVAPSGQELTPSPGDGMSFERMFSGISPGAATSPDALDDHVQRQPADGDADVTAPAATTAPVSQPAIEATAIVPGGTAAGGGALSPEANLDEMARRLYEPLAARLREELWLDRERAGLMRDA